MAKPGDVLHLPYETDVEFRERATIGLLAQATDHTIEHEFRQMLGIPGVAVYVSRLQFETGAAATSLQGMKEREMVNIAGAASLILPGTQVDVIAYGCTTPTIYIGESEVGSCIRAIRPGVKSTNPISAAMAALRSLKVTKIALIAPYSDDIMQQMKHELQAREIEVVSMGSFNEDDASKAGQIGWKSIYQAALSLGKSSEVEAVYVCDTSLRIADKVEELEAQLSKPVISSNSALAWHALRLAGIDDNLPFGRLHKVPLLESFYDNDRQLFVKAKNELAKAKEEMQREAARHPKVSEAHQGLIDDCDWDW